MDHDLLGITGQNIPLEIPHIKCILKQVLEGVAFMHSNQVMHRDIKGANILMNNKGEIKLADFGLARFTGDNNRNYTSPVVTLWYRSPELLLGSTRYSSSIDIWSVGCIFAELLNSKPLFQGRNEAKMLELIYQICGTPTDEEWPDAKLLKFYKELGPKKPMPKTLRTIFANNKK